MRLLPVPRGLASPAELCVQEAQGVPPPIHKVEDLLHVAVDPDALHDQVEHIGVGVQAPGGDPHHYVGNLPPVVSVLHHLQQVERSKSRCST